MTKSTRVGTCIRCALCCIAKRFLHIFIVCIVTQKCCDKGIACTHCIYYIYLANSLCVKLSPPLGMEKGLWQNSKSPDSSPISYMGKSTIQQNS